MASYDSQVLGLFADPGVVQQSITAERNQQMPSGLTFLPAQTLFQGLSPLSAALDPRTRNARTIQETARETPGEFGSISYYQDLANRLNAKGMTQAAMALQAKAKEMQDDLKDTATAEFGKISFKDYGSYTVPLASLINQYAMTQDPQQKQALFAQINEMMQKGRAEVQTGDVSDAQQKARAEAEAKQKVEYKFELMKQLGEDKNAQNASATLIGDIRRNIIEPLDRKEIITGPGADFRATAWAFGRVLFPNLGGDELAVKLGRTQAAANVIGDALLGAIKKLGTNPSNADREFIQRMLPNINQDPNAIRMIYRYLQEKALFAQEELNARERWLQDHDDLMGYVPPQAEALNEMLREVGIDTSISNTQGNPAINSIGTVRVPTIKEDMTGQQINQYNSLVINKGSNEAVYDFLGKLLETGKITADQKVILKYLDNVLYGAR